MTRGEPFGSSTTPAVGTRADDSCGALRMPHDTCGGHPGGTVVWYPSDASRHLGWGPGRNSRVVPFGCLTTHGMGTQPGGPGWPEGIIRQVPAWFRRVCRGGTRGFQALSISGARLGGARGCRCKTLIPRARAGPSRGRGTVEETEGPIDHVPGAFLLSPEAARWFSRRVAWRARPGAWKSEGPPRHITRTRSPRRLGIRRASQAQARAATARSARRSRRP